MLLRVSEADYYASLGIALAVDLHEMIPCRDQHRLVTHPLNARYSLLVPLDDSQHTQFVVNKVDMLVCANDTLDSLSVICGEPKCETCPFDVKDSFIIMQLQANVATGEDTEVFYRIPVQPVLREGKEVLLR